MGDDPESLQTDDRIVADRGVGDRQWSMRIERKWAIGMYEVTRPQFKKYRPSQSVHPVINPEPNGPQTSMQWYDAAKYCRWLSEQEKLSEEDQCFPAATDIKAGLRLPDHYLAELVIVSPPKRNGNTHAAQGPKAAFISVIRPFLSIATRGIFCQQTPCLQSRLTEA